MVCVFRRGVYNGDNDEACAITKTLLAKGDI